MSDYIPQNDAMFAIWQTNLIGVIEPNVVMWGILPADFTALTDKQSVWSYAYEKASSKQNRTMADVQAKDDARVLYEKAIRVFVAQWLASNTRVTDSDRESLGLTVRTGTHTPVPPPSTLPIGNIDFSVNLQHSIHYFDQTTPQHRAKPAGVHGCEIWMKIDGQAPVKTSELFYLATDTRSPHVLTFDGDQAGKMVYYRLRWVNRRGEPGPWSNIISSMVVG